MRFRAADLFRLGGCQRPYSAKSNPAPDVCHRVIRAVHRQDPSASPYRPIAAPHQRAWRKGGTGPGQTVRVVADHALAIDNPARTRR
jgi:hypothetical protein